MASTSKEDGQPSIGSLVQEATKDFSTVLRGEIELAKLELTSTVKYAGAGAGFFVGAVVLVLFSLTFGFIALAEGLIALHIWRWAAFLIVFGFLLLVVAALVWLGIRSIKRVKAPKRTIATGKETMAQLKRPGQHA
ncbi:MAG TPA: phage holin family protein [Jatrophihabitantaceae bacterium]|nr:phage holin family protein [Jatrophihabitantaceae bacterium]